MSKRLLSMLVATGLAAPISLAVGIGAAQAQSTDFLAGANRYETSVQVAQKAYPTQAANVYLARGDMLADALSAGSFQDGPILLVDKSGLLNTAVKAYVSGLNVSGKIIALGGNSVVPQAIVDDIASGKATGRIQGASRLSTSAEITKAAYPNGASVVYLADGFGSDGNGSADAVAGGALHDGPVLLVDKNNHSATGSNADAAAAIKALHPSQVVALGGSGAIPEDLGQTLAKETAAGFTRIQGANRYETAVAIASRAFPDKPTAVYVARGDVFADAVAASALKDGPILLSPTAPSASQNYAAGYIKAQQPASVSFLGKSFWDANVVATVSAGNTYQPPAPQPSPQQPQQPQQPAPNQGQSLEQIARQIEDYIHQGINAKRASMGVAPLTRFEEGDSKARAWSQIMLQTGEFEHSNHNNQIGILTIRHRAVGENIYYTRGYDLDPATLAQKMVQGWIDSPGHFRNLSNRTFSLTGIGIAISADGSTVYATQNFASSR